MGTCGLINPGCKLPDEFEYIDLESVVGTEIINHRHERKGSAPSRAQRLAAMGDIFYQTVRPYQKNNYLFEMPDGSFVFSTGYAQIRPYIDERFLFTLIQTDEFVIDVLNSCTGTSYPAIGASDLANIDVNIPTEKEEQTAIGFTFFKIDNLITLHQRKVELLKKIKSACLDAMFV